MMAAFILFIDLAAVITLFRLSSDDYWVIAVFIIISIFGTSIYFMAMRDRTKNLQEQLDSLKREYEASKSAGKDENTDGQAKTGSSAQDSGETASEDKKPEEAADDNPDDRLLEESSDVNENTVAGEPGKKRA